jgi:hypothetical protein
MAAQAPRRATDYADSLSASSSRLPLAVTSTSVLLPLSQAIVSTSPARKVNALFDQRSLSGLRRRALRSDGGHFHPAIAFGGQFVNP